MKKFLELGVIDLLFTIFLLTAGINLLRYLFG